MLQVIIYCFHATHNYFFLLKFRRKDPRCSATARTLDLGKGYQNRYESTNTPLLPHPFSLRNTSLFFKGAFLTCAPLLSLGFFPFASLRSRPRSIMGSLFRSEKMTMAQLFLQSESAYFCIRELGELVNNNNV